MDHIKIEARVQHAGWAPRRVSQVLRVGVRALVALEEPGHRTGARAGTVRPAVRTHEARVKAGRRAVGFPAAQKLACVRVDMVQWSKGKDELATATLGKRGERV